jgi:lysozyme
MHDLLARVLRREEGCKLHPYADSEGFWTIGIGHLIDRRKGGALPSWIQPSFPITMAEAEQLFELDARAFEDGFDGSARAAPFWGRLDAVRKVVLVGMAFQMGVEGVFGFKQMIVAITEERWSDAAVEMLDSKWAGQSPARAKRMARAMASGEASAFDLVEGP